MDLPIDEYEAQVRRARQTARQVLACGFISLAVGWLIVVTCAIAWLGFDVPILEVLDIVLAIGVGGILGGIGLYATSRSLGITASRLEIDLETKLRPK